MNRALNTSAPKRPTNLSINSELLDKARELKINLSATLETALTDAIKIKERERWRQENESTIAAYNEMVEAQGTFSDDVRSF